MTPVVTNGISIEIITDVLGTKTVKAKPAKKALEVLPNVDRIRLLDTSPANVADKYFSQFFKDNNNSPHPTMKPNHAGIYSSTKFTHGLIRLNIEGISINAGILEKNELPTSAIVVNVWKKYSTEKKITKVQKLYQ